MDSICQQNLLLMLVEMYLFLTEKVSFLYKDHFDRFNREHNLIAWYGKCCSQDQFKFTLKFQVNTKYILVVTTYDRYTTGPFSITAFGSDTVRFQRIGESYMTLILICFFFVFDRSRISCGVNLQICIDKTSSNIQSYFLLAR